MIPDNPTCSPNNLHSAHVNMNSSTNLTLYSNGGLSQYGMKLVIPNGAWGPFGPFACGTSGSPAHWGTTTCCFYNTFGNDFTWQSTDCNITSLPLCTAGTCS